MMIEDKILLVARYAEGDLSEDEQMAFESRLHVDEELKQQLADYTHIHQSLKIQFAQNKEDALFKDTLQQLNKQYFSNETKTVSFKPYLKWVGSIAAVLVIGLMIWAPWNGNLYQQYAVNDQMQVTERGAAPETDLDKAATLYNESKFAEAAVILAKLNTQEPSNTIVSYYYGQTLIRTENLAKARAVLTPIFNGESVFKYDAAYAIAMSYLKENQKIDCKAWLEKIPEGTTNYQKAQALIVKL